MGLNSRPGTGEPFWKAKGAGAQGAAEGNRSVWGLEGEEALREGGEEGIRGGRGVQAALWSWKLFGPHTPA